jgi:hypothetical protein
MKEDFKTARSVLSRAARQNPRAWILAKYFWSVLAPQSLREEIIRRAAVRDRQQTARNMSVAEGRRLEADG